MIKNVHKYMMLCFVLVHTTFLFGAVGKRLDDVMLSTASGARFNPYESAYAQKFARFKELKFRCLDNEFLHSVKLQRLQELHQEYGNDIFFMTNRCGQTPIEVAVYTEYDDMYDRISYMVDHLPAEDLKSLLLTRTSKDNKHLLGFISCRDILVKIFNKCSEQCIYAQSWKKVDDDDQEQQVKAEYQVLQAKCLDNNFLHFAKLSRLQQLHQQYGNAIFFMTNDRGQTPIELVVSTRPNDMYDRISYMVDHLPADDLKLLLLTRTGRYKGQVLGSIYDIGVLAKIFAKCPELCTKDLAGFFFKHRVKVAASFVKTRAAMLVASKEGCAKH